MAAYRRRFAVNLVAVLAAGAALAAVAAGARAEPPTVRVVEEPVVSQPPPFATRGRTVVVPRTRIEIDDGSGAKILSGDPLRRKKTEADAAAEDAAPPAAAEPACTHSKILCGDPLRRKKKAAERRE